MTSPRALPRVVLLEDDVSLRRFVEMALEEMPIDLVACARSADALEAFRQGPVSLLLSDLMLVGESSLPLLERLATDSALGGGARIVVWSAGLTPESRQHLLSLGVWRVMTKPIGLGELEHCVEQALTDAAGSSKAAAANESHRPAAEDEADAIARHFEGDAELYRAFRQSCIEQFGLDAASGDEACAAGDAQALRRVAHNLKTVLRSLGHASLGHHAALVESQAADGDFDAAVAEWRQLQPALLSLSGSAG